MLPLVPEGGKLKSAVELLEQGRAVVWARLQVYQHSLEKPRQVDDGIVKDFQTLGARLEEHAISSDVGMKSEAVSESTVPAVSIDEKMKQHRVLSK